MQITKWSLQDAKNKFSAVVDAAQNGQAQVITRRGVASAVVLSIEEFEKFQRYEAAESPSFIDHLLSMPADDGEFERIALHNRDKHPVCLVGNCSLSLRTAFNAFISIPKSGA